jgi:hypothetical protein
MREMFTSRREKAPYSTGKYAMTIARKPKPTPLSMTVTARAISPRGVTSPKPRVKKVVPLR